MTISPLVEDPRLTPARRDLAAAKLKDRIAAPRYSEGEAFTVLTETVDMKRAPRPDAALDTQLLYGETLIVYDDDNGWGWAQADRDGYVGYVAMSALGRSAIAATHRVIVGRTFVYPAADMKQPPYAVVPMDGRVCVEGTSGAFAKIRGHGFVFSAHIAPLASTPRDDPRHDPVAVAEGLIGTPYLWGGRTALGIDCSGLVQLAFAMAGAALPRDTDMQERCGTRLPATFDRAAAASDLRRNDLIFWKGHVGLMVDPVTIVHANGFHMLVMKEPLDTVRQRNLEANLPISSATRLL